ncbi:hypothetical protein [Metabacillus sp. RGM 3146]|uniref:YqgU-like beta propeller domain-containing protein n=1 Tax=Metabacillus sp. RGM 3146 TaxID=3401092 RepID=UPI003B9A7C78
MKEKKGKRISAAASFLLIGVFLTGCNNLQHEQAREKQPHAIKSPAVISHEKEEPLKTYKTSENNFHMVSGWMDAEHILIVEEQNHQFILYSYQIHTGEKTTIYKSSSTINAVKINQKSNLILLQESSTANNNTLKILDEKGNPVYSCKIPAYQLDTAWNEEDSDELYVTAFNEDWTFKTFLLHPLSNKKEESPLEIPFVIWEDAENLSYIKWNKDEPQIEAPLYSFSLQSGKEKLLKSKAVKHEVYGDILLTIGMENESHMGAYSFSNWKSGSEIMTMHAPLLSNYSEWQPPNYDFDPNQRLFYLFRQKHQNAFDLMAYSLAGKKPQVIAKNLGNEPISISPDGTWALYGARYEKIISLKQHTASSMIVFK